MEFPPEALAILIKIGVFFAYWIALVIGVSAVAHILYLTSKVGEKIRAERIQVIQEAKRQLIEAVRDDESKLRKLLKQLEKDNEESHEGAARVFLITFLITIPLFLVTF